MFAGRQFVSNRAPAKVELGRQLFEDAHLSGDESLSCASCHPKEMGYADATRFSDGAGGQPMPRHTPTVLNAAYYRYINWDGKFASIPNSSWPSWPIRGT